MDDSPTEPDRRGDDREGGPAGNDHHAVVDVPEASRYELRVGGTTIGLADYTIEDDVLVIPHVETHVAHRGNGHAARLMDGIIADVRRRGMRIRPICSYAAAHLRDHPDRDELVTRR